LEESEFLLSWFKQFTEVLQD